MEIEGITLALKNEDLIGVSDGSVMDNSPYPTGAKSFVLSKKQNDRTLLQGVPPPPS